MSTFWYACHCLGTSQTEHVKNQPYVIDLLYSGMVISRRLSIYATSFIDIGIANVVCVCATSPSPYRCSWRCSQVEVRRGVLFVVHCGARVALLKSVRASGKGKTVLVACLKQALIRKWARQGSSSLQLVLILRWKEHVLLLLSSSSITSLLLWLLWRIHWREIA